MIFQYIHCFHQCLSAGPSSDISHHPPTIHFSPCKAWHRIWIPSITWCLGPFCIGETGGISESNESIRKWELHTDRVLLNFLGNPTTWRWTAKGTSKSPQLKRKIIWTKPPFLGVHLYFPNYCCCFFFPAEILVWWWFGLFDLVAHSCQRRGRH